MLCCDRARGLLPCVSSVSSGRGAGPVSFTSVSQIPVALLSPLWARRRSWKEMAGFVDCVASTDRGIPVRHGVTQWNVRFHLASALCQVDNAYWLWTFQGRLLQKNNKDRFCQLLWRPRPPTLLSQDQIKVCCAHRVKGT